jgi:hypothetical protein
VKAGGVVDAKADGVVDGVSIFFEIYGWIRLYIIVLGRRFW